MKEKFKKKRLSLSLLTWNKRFHHLNYIFILTKSFKSFWEIFLVNIFIGFFFSSPKRIFGGKKKARGWRQWSRKIANKEETDTWKSSKIISAVFLPSLFSLSCRTQTFSFFFFKLFFGFEKIRFLVRLCRRTF